MPASSLISAAGGAGNDENGNFCTGQFAQRFYGTGDKRSIQELLPAEDRVAAAEIFQFGSRGFAVKKMANVVAEFFKTGDAAAVLLIFADVPGRLRTGVLEKLDESFGLYVVGIGYGSVPVENCRFECHQILRQFIVYLNS